jgi:hypothetical protein
MPHRTARHRAGDHRRPECQPCCAQRLCRRDYLGAALCLATSCFLSYVALRDDTVRRAKAERWADRIFLVGLVALILAIVVLAIESR